MLQENIGEKRTEAMDNMDRLGAVTAEFVSDMAIRWFQEAPGVVQEFFYVAKSGADNMAGAFSRLSNDGFQRRVCRVPEHWRHSGQAWKWCECPFDAILLAFLSNLKPKTLVFLAQPGPDWGY